MLESHAYHVRICSEYEISKLTIIACNSCFLWRPMTRGSQTFLHLIDLFFILLICLIKDYFTFNQVEVKTKDKSPKSNQDIPEWFRMQSSIKAKSTFLNSYRYNEIGTIAYFHLMSNIPKVRCMTKWEPSLSLSEVVQIKMQDCTWITWYHGELEEIRPVTNIAHLWTDSLTKSLTFVSVQQYKLQMNYQHGNLVLFTKASKFEEKKIQNE